MDTKMTALVSTGLDRIYRLGSRALRLHPQLRAWQRDVEVTHNVSYGPRADQVLDVVVPRGSCGPRPVVLYIHGGGFNVLSKDSHWMFATAFARGGFTVFNIDYRLAPRHPYPAALEDVAAAYVWAVEHAGAWGGRGPVVVAGESAGANLALALALAATHPRPEPWTRRVWELGQPPAACVAQCGLLQVTDCRRFHPRGWTRALVRFRLQVVEAAYGAPCSDPGEPSLADPLRVLESSPPPREGLPFPPTMISVGTADPLLEDSRRLHAALERRGSPVELREYPGQPHAFQALAWRPEARRAWGEILDFLARYAV